VSDLLADRSLGQVPAADKQDGVSIFIPNWNHQSFLSRSIRSALASAEALEHAGCPAEVIVVDDASRDGSQRLLRSIAGYVSNWRFGTVLLSENLGLTGVRNLGLRLARYRSVLFLDADNELVPGAVPVLYRSFQMTEAALVYGNLIDVDRGKAVAVRSNEVALLTLTIDNYIDALALVDAVQALEIGGYVSDRSLDYWADWEFILHLISEERNLVFVPIVVGRYHKVPFSMIDESAQRQGTDLRRMRRIFSQTGTLEWDSRRVGRIYHPDVGYLDEDW
jgi:glycosyltransferase involved in cell wall biosynthesis